MLTGMRHGTRKRQRYDPLAPIREACWLVVLDRLRTALETRKLPPGTDLRAVLTTAHAERIAAGWACETDGRFGFFFCHQDGVRVMVGIHRVEPGKLPPAHKTPDY